MTNYEKETLKNIERTAKHGESIALKDKDEHNDYLDLFNHILTELSRVNYK